MRASLSYRELEVLFNISMGFTTGQIAQKLYLSDHTIITYRKSLLNKLEASNAPEMIRIAFEAGILPKNSSYGERPDN